MNLRAATLGDTSGRLAQPETREVVDYSHYANGEWQQLSWAPPEEMGLSVLVNEQELVTILCTPEKLNCLVLGFLRSEGFITSLDEIAMMRICLEESVADVRLTHQLAVIPVKRTITSGCGAGTTFEQGANIQPLSSSWRVSPAQILASMKLLQRKPESQE